MDCKKYFKGKKITLMGLGLLGRGVGDAALLAECGAELVVTDLKTSLQLKESVSKLKKYKNIKYTLGEHKLEDFRDKDFILKAAGVPLDSVYIEEAKKNKIPIEMSAALFAKLSGIPMVGVTGTRGKSTVTHLIAHILKSAGKKVILGGNVRGVSNLQLLKKVTGKEIAVFELDSWQLQGFGEARISPHIAVFTSFLSDHMNYYKNDTGNYFADKANIFKYQKAEDILIIRPDVEKLVPKNLKSKLIVVSAKNVADYKFVLPGEFQQENLACAVEVAKQFGIPETIIKKAVKSFKGLEGRLQYVKTVKGVKIYNDNNATTPEATAVGIEALKNNRNIVLVSGGSDKGLDLAPLIEDINSYCKAVVLVPGTGTDRLIKNYEFKVPSEIAKDLKEAVEKSLGLASRGDTILFSPAFASFGLFTNEYERNDLFMKIVKKLK